MKYSICSSCCFCWSNKLHTKILNFFSDATTLTTKTCVIYDLILSDESSLESSALRKYRVKGIFPVFSSLLSTNNLIKELLKNFYFSFFAFLFSVLLFISDTFFDVALKSYRICYNFIDKHLFTWTWIFHRVGKTALMDR
jgi:hypothetical protein